MPPAGADSGFPDSDFDWNVLSARTTAERPPGSPTARDYFAWVVVVLLTFCPLLGFAIAMFWWR
jgi:hypothetical protein